MQPMTATQQIILALAEKATVTVDHETRAFIGFRFHLADQERPTVVRVHKSQPEAAALLAVAT